MKITVFFIIGVILLIAGYDVWVIVEHGKQASVSATLIRWSYEYPSLTFLMGFTFGHLYWRMASKDIWKGNEK